MNPRGSTSGNGRAIAGVTPLVLTVTISLIVVGAVGSGLYLLSNSSQHYSAQQTVSLAIGSVTFSPSWHYTGNVTLSGSESVCGVLRLPCTANPQNQAEELKSSDGREAYVETAQGCGPQGCTNWTIVLINSNVYCVNPKDNIPSQPACPSLIN